MAFAETEGWKEEGVDPVTGGINMMSAARKCERSSKYDVLCGAISRFLVSPYIMGGAS
jgi:hypothetical protein